MSLTKCWEVHPYNTQHRGKKLSESVEAPGKGKKGRHFGENSALLGPFPVFLSEKLPVLSSGRGTEAEKFPPNIWGDELAILEKKYKAFPP